MKKIVINKCYGGFGLSDAAVVRYHEIKGVPMWVEHDSKYGSLGISHYWLVPESERVADLGDEFYKLPMEERQAHNQKWSEQTFSIYDLKRDDPVLVQVVEEMGQDASGRFAELKVVDIPDDVKWEIAEYDGMESVHEVHRIWS